LKDLLDILRTGLNHEQLVRLYDIHEARTDFNLYIFFSDPERGFNNQKTYGASREATIWRLDDLYKQSPVFTNMFNAPKTKLDLGALLMLERSS
jgi:hypothetical protein